MSEINEGVIPRKIYNRRQFLKRAGIVAGGAIAALVGGKAIWEGAQAIGQQIENPQQAKARKAFQEAKLEDLKTIKTGKDGANLRNVPSLTSEKVAYLPPGTVVNKAYLMSVDQLRITEEQKVTGAWYAFPNPTKEDEMVFSVEENFTKISMERPTPTPQNTSTKK